ncbi:uncharacterized protein AB675_5711 [Cyphellophora attinorum]|uniref:alpha-galactosidase n=1 Tax=Cyphellophora attinorum TaxID=1664694 RepID=A0A0N1P082_9EURO|nr:uncharacterized protein AB675_5711 [Phialophora attinorum]KPI41830.1 hypothetical protein AB675_5711 [Phialophora attinorum]
MNRDAFQAGYDAGHKAGFDAGYAAGLAAADHRTPPSAHQSHLTPSQQQPSLPIRPPPVPQRPTVPAHHDGRSSREIWQPAVGTSFQYVLSHPVQLNHRTCPVSQAAVWIVDLFDTPAESVSALHAQGRKVIAYFSAGSYEDWRPDASKFAKSDLGRNMDGWEGEKWLQVKSTNVRDIVLKRMDLAVQKGFDGIDPDNVDGYDNKNGLGLTKRDAIDYVTFLSREGHARGLSVGMKNGGDVSKDVVDHVEYCVQEQAVQYDDEEAFSIYLKKGKPIFHVEYPKGDDPDNKKQNDERLVEGKKRDKAFRLKSKGWSTIIKNVKMDQWIQVD